MESVLGLVPLASSPLDLCERPSFGHLNTPDITYTAIYLHGRITAVYLEVEFCLFAIFFLLAYVVCDHCLLVFSVYNYNYV